MATNENLPPNVIKQLAKELKNLDESPPEGIKVVVNDDDFSTIFADIEGPAGTPYENGVFRMKLLLSHDFPHSPPKGFFLTKIFHPNIATNGEICVNTLKKDWNPSLGLRHVLIVVRCLLIEPFPESALNEQAGKMLLENYDEYARHARLYTGIHAKPKPKFKSGAISESTTALNVDQTNTSVLSADVKTTAASAALPVPVPVPATRGNSQEQAATSVITSATVISTASAPQKKEAKALVDKLLPSDDDDTSHDSSLLLSHHYAFLRNALINSSTHSDDSSNDAVSMSNAIRTGFGSETRNFLRQFRGKLSESLVVEVMNLVKRPELCVEFFLWASRQIGYTHTPVVYTALIELLCCNEVHDRVSDMFLMQIRDDDRELLRKLLNVLIQKCCRNGMWNVALEELGRLKDFGYQASPATYNALIQVFLRADKLDTAYLVQKEMSNYGFLMDGYTLSCFAYSLCKVGRFGDALSLIEKEGFVPDTVFYNRMVSGLCEASRFEEAMEILDRMRSNSCIPNVFTYRVLVSGCLGKGQLGRCKRILSMMMTEGCYPNREMFNSLVHAYCKSGDYSYAYKLFKKMDKCGCQPSYLLYNIFIGSVCGNEELPGSDVLELAEKAYSEMLDSGLVLNKVNVSNFARCLCGAGKFDEAFKVICEMMSKGFIPDDSTYSKVIGFLCDASKVEKAFLLFEEMKKNGIVPSVYTYTILIDSFCKAGLIQQAHKWFDEMLRDGCIPNVVTYTALIHAYLKARKVFDANKLFQMMLIEGCKPNVVTYTALIDGHCKAGQIDKACQIYARMQGDMESSDIDMYFKLDDNDCETPNIITYGALVDGLCKANRVKEARELLDTMSINGCEPNQIVYDALIDGFCKTGELESAREVFVKMSERGYSPNLYTYSSLINSLFKEKRLDLVLKVLSKMLENSCTPNVVIYTEMIDGLCKVGKTDEAYKLMLKMEEVGCYPNVVTYTAMIDGFGKLGNIEQCLELYTGMCSKGCAPNFITYRVLINHCCSTGLLDEAHRLLDEMTQTYWPRHLSSYRKIIEGFNREFVISIGLLDELSENESAPVESLYRILVDKFIKAGRLEVALNLLEEISSSPSPAVANKYLYISLIESLSLASKVDKAFELYASMINKNVVPELSTFVYLIKGLTRVGRWQEALQLSDSICQMDICWLHEEVTDAD